MAFARRRQPYKIETVYCLHMSMLKMKILLTVIWLSIFCASTFAQSKETFDLVTYAIPKGWKKEVKPNANTSFTIIDQKKKTYCQINILMSVNSKGGIKEDFESEWRALIVESYKVTDTPQVTESKSDSGWIVKAGMAPFIFNNEKAVAMLTTITGYNKTVSIVAVTNSGDYLQPIQSFLASVEMKVPDTISRAQTDGSSIIGTWCIVQGGGQAYEDHKNGNAGNNYDYIKKQYTFNVDHTYTFYSKAFKMAFDKILLITERGSYRLNGDHIIIIPEKSVTEAWSKKNNIDEWGKLLTTQNRKLEKVTYTFTNHYFSGIQQWNLVLQAAAPTERDGPYIGNLTFKNAWLFAPISTNNPAIELPGAKQNTNVEAAKEIIQSPTSNGFAFTTTNFDDGWVATVQEDWVLVSKGTTKVLIHYPNKNVDAYNPVLLDGLKNAWNALVAPKYSSASNMEFKPISNWESIEFAEADVVEKATGRTVHVVLFKKNKTNGRSNYLEFITPDKKSFENEFGAYHQSSTGWEKMENMGGYNKFAIAASDLRGKWTNSFSGTTQYVNAITGLDAGMTSHASVENFIIGPGNEYNWDVAVASGVVGNLKFQNAKSSGKFSVLSNWQVNFSNIEGKARTYNAHFSCIKGLRILWLDDFPFGKIE
jgi:hypothetical protein